MNITYFLTGSFNDVDNDFELTINLRSSRDGAQSKDNCKVVLSDISSEKELIWHTAQPTFVLCLNDLDEFIIEYNILFYSKILTSSHRDIDVDKALEGFILDRLKH